MAYRNATICLNRHVISKTTANAEKYCSKCGSETYSYCLNCKAPVHGLYDDPNIAVIGKRVYNIPYYCYNCGTPYPWTQKILDNATELVSLDDSLDESSKELIKNALPGLIVDSPATTPLAVTNYKKGMASAGDILKNCMYQLLVDVVSETVKKLLFS